MLIYIYEPVPKGAHIPCDIFAVCFQKIKTSFSNKSVLSPLHLWDNNTERAAKVQKINNKMSPADRHKHPNAPLSTRFYQSFRKIFGSFGL